MKTGLNNISQKPFNTLFVLWQI